LHINAIKKEDNKLLLENNGFVTTQNRNQVGEISFMNPVKTNPEQQSLQKIKL